MHQVYGLAKPRPKAAILPGASLIGRTLEGVSSAVTPAAAQSAATPAETERLAAADTEEEEGDDVEQAGERSPQTPPKGRLRQKPPSPEVSPRPQPEGVPPPTAVRVHAPPFTAAACAALTQ